MVWTDNEKSQVTDIEKLLNKIQIAITNLASRAQLRQLLLVKQKEIDDLKTRVTSLESRIKIIEDSNNI